MIDVGDQLGWEIERNDTVCVCVCVSVRVYLRQCVSVFCMFSFFAMCSF